MTDEANPVVLATVWKKIGSSEDFEDDQPARLVMMAIAGCVTDEFETVYLTIPELARLAGVKSVSTVEQVVNGRGNRSKAKDRAGLKNDGWLSVAPRGKFLGSPKDRPLAFKLGHKITGDHNPADASLGCPTFTKTSVAPTKTKASAKAQVAPTYEYKDICLMSDSREKREPTKRNEKENTSDNSYVAPTEELAQNEDHDDWLKEFEASRRASGSFIESADDSSDDPSGRFKAQMRNELRELSYA
jgi:hypothetical protein